MALHNTSIRERGFTILELLIAIAIGIVLLSTGVLFTLSDYRGSALQRERHTLATLLQTARAAAVYNINEVPHGVAINPADHPHSYVLFEGEEYDSAVSKDVIDQAYTFEIGPGSARTFVFAQLSGDVKDPGSVIFRDATRGIEESVTVNGEGGIEW